MANQKQIEQLSLDLEGEIEYSTTTYYDYDYTEVDIDHNSTAKNILDKGYVNAADFIEYLKSIADVYEVGIQPRRVYEITDHQFDKALEEYLNKD